MPPFRTIDLQFPMSGLDKRLSYQSQKPFSSPSMSNVRPDGTLEGRQRGGSRPGLVRDFQTRIGSGDPVRMAAVMRSLQSENRKVFIEDFDSIAEWTPMTDFDVTWAPQGQLDIDLGQVVIIQGSHKGSVLDDGNLPLIKDGNDRINAQYAVEVWVANVPRLSPIGFTEIYVYARLNDTVPSSASNAFMKIVVANVGDGIVDITMHVGSGDSSTQFFSTSITSGFRDGWMRLTVDPQLATGQWIAGPLSPVPTGPIGTHILPSSAINESRVGLRVHNALNSGGAFVVLDDFVVRYVDGTGGLPPESLVAAAKHGGITGKQGSNVWYETNISQMVEAKSDRDGSGASFPVLTDLNDSVHLMAVDRLGKLYIADHGVRKEDLDGKVSASPFKTFDDVANTDWSEATATVGVDKDGDWLEILSTGDGGTAILGVYKITGASASGVTVDTAMATAEETGGVKYRVVRGAKIFDPAAASASRLTRWEAKASKGNVPLGCTIIEAWRDRMVMGGDPESPGVWFMSRQGDPDDWLFGDTDAQAAVAGTSTTSDAGQLPNPISAITSVGRDYLYISAESEQYVLVGDPMQGGVLDNISRQIGIGSRTAFCRTPDGGIVFLSRDGLYYISPATQSPVAISVDKLPRDFLNLVQNTDNNVMMEYDVRDYGIHIFITPTTSGPATHWWYDWITKAFVPVTLQSNHDPFSIVFQAKGNNVILGSRDGYLRRFDSAASDDDGFQFNSHILYGPFRLGGLTRNGNLAELQIVLDDNSGDVDWDVFVGDSAEDAFSSASFDSGTVSAGRNGAFRPRTGGHTAYLRLKNNTNKRWAVETITLELERTGKTRIQ